MSVTIFARVSVVGVDSDLNVQNCDINIDYLKNVKKTIFQVVEVSQLYVSLGWKEKGIRMEKYQEKTEDGYRRYR